MQPIGDLRTADLERFVGGLCVQWICTGMIWAGGAKLAEQGSRPALMLPAVFLGAWLVCIALGSLMGNLAPGDFGGQFNRALGLDTRIYELWINAFYGALYTLGYFTARRTRRLQHRLVALRVSRNEAEARLREARLKAMRGQIQPEMMLEALRALQRAYALDRREGDALFDLLVGFLRAAMPGLRGGASTLTAQLQVVDRYANLRAALNVGAPCWRLAICEPIVDIPFPPLRLLPALDALSRAVPAETSIEVTTIHLHDAFLVRISAPAAQPMPQSLLQQLRSDMRQTLGPRANLSLPSGSVIAELRLKPPVHTSTSETKS